MPRQQSPATAGIASCVQEQVALALWRAMRRTDSSLSRDFLASLGSGFSARMTAPRTQRQPAKRIALRLVKG
jgi:hypothetical protein